MKIIARRNPEKIKAEAIAYLAETDWYVTRMTETGTPIPDDVQEKRAQAREAASS